MTQLEPGDSSALSLLAESPDEKTKSLVYGDLSDEGKKIAEAMVPTKKAASGKIKGALGKPRAHVAEEVEEAVQSTADALLRWSK
jgi:hypothetical protein